MAIQKVGVIGCGLMGSGIAQVSAQAGFPTVVREVSANALEKGLTQQIHAQGGRLAIFHPGQEMTIGVNDRLGQRALLHVQKKNNLAGGTT
jgi:glycerol-3-phosphate dehydrogenase